MKGGILKGIYIPDVLLEEDRILVRQRFSFVKDITRIKNRVKSLLKNFAVGIPDHISSQQSRHWSSVYTKWLRQISEGEANFGKTLLNHIEQAEKLREILNMVTKQIHELSRGERYEERYQLITSIPGIGLMSGMTILTEINDIKRFKRLDELCSFVGLMPRMNSSGERESTGKLVNRGRKEIKVMLLEAAWVGVRVDPALMLKFSDLSKRMNKNKAIIRIARKLLNRIRYVLVNKAACEKGIIE